MERLSNVPEQETKVYRGIQDIELTTSGWLFTPESAFAIVHELNKKRRTEGKPLIKLEVYSTLRPKILEMLSGLAGRTALKKIEQFIPPTITSDVVANYLRKYPEAVVSDIHPEFNFSRAEEFLRMTIGEDLLPKTASDEIKDRMALGIKQRGYQAAWALFFGPASSGRGVNVAEELNREYGYIGLTMHPNLVEGFAGQRKLEDIKRGVYRLLAETERPYNYSPHLPRGAKGRRLLSDPETVRQEIVLKYNLDGMVLGADHMLERGEDPTPAYKKTADITRKIHISGGRDGKPHQPISVGQADVEYLLKAIANISHEKRLSVALDYNPLEIKRLSSESQLDLIRETIKWIESTQGV